MLFSARLKTQPRKTFVENFFLKDSIEIKANFDRDLFKNLVFGNFMEKILQIFGKTESIRTQQKTTKNKKIKEEKHNPERTPLRPKISF